MGLVTQSRVETQWESAGWFKDASKQGENECFCPTAVKESDGLLLREPSGLFLQSSEF